MEKGRRRRRRRVDHPHQHGNHGNYASNGNGNSNGTGNIRRKAISTSDRHDFESIAQYLQHMQIPMSEIDEQRLSLVIPANRINEVQKEISRLNGTIYEADFH